MRQHAEQQAEQRTAPRISTTSPPAGSVSGGETVTVTGNGLAGASVEIDGQLAAVTASSDTEVSFISPPHGAGVVAVLVRTPGGSAASRSYTYQ
jgi:hypothetical protein